MTKLESVKASTVLMKTRKIDIVQHLGITNNRQVATDPVGFGDS
jgi:hypothetical protein